MNRTFALLLAAAILVAHMLAIHEGVADTFAPPYEVAHVAFRLAHNLVESGRLAWEPDGPIVEGYPSLSWVLLASVPEALSLSTATFMQALSALCALATTWVLARFSPVRLAGVIAPLLFVAAGAVASAAAGGTEMTLAALLVTASFLAYEHERPLALGLLLSLACLTRPECVPLAAVLLAIELVRSKRPDPTTPRRSMLAPFAAPALVVAAACAVRLGLSGQLLSPWARTLIDPEHLHPWRALAFLRDFFATSGAGMLIVFPLWYLLRGSLTGLGTRALVLTLAWCVLAGLGGDGPQTLPYSQFMVPILAVLLVAVQEAMTLALDSKRPWLPRLTWVLFVLGLVVSTVASKFPGNLGPLPLDGPHRAWMAGRAPRPLGQSERLGRDSLQEEIKRTGQLRRLGEFLRDHLEDHRLSVLTPWPGAIGYLSSLRVVDALSRVTPRPGSERLQPWGSLGSWDIVAVLEQRPDYIVPGQGPRPEPPTVAEIAELWSQDLDRGAASPARRSRLLVLLGEYELISVPAGLASGPAGGERFLLMRRLDLGAQPTLAASLEGGELVVSVRHGAHEQLVDLLVELVDEHGQSWSLRPSGEAGAGTDLRARRSILLFPTGARPIELLRVALPGDLRVRSVRAVLLNPGATGTQSPVCPDVILEP